MVKIRRRVGENGEMRGRVLGDSGRGVGEGEERGKWGVEG